MCTGLPACTSGLRYLSKQHRHVKATSWCQGSLTSCLGRGLLLHANSPLAAFVDGNVVASMDDYSCCGMSLISETPFTRLLD